MTPRIALAIGLACGTSVFAPALEVYTKGPVTDRIATPSEVKACADSIYFWATPKERILTYWIDAASFLDAAEARLVETSLQAAAQDWMDACPEAGLRFAPAPRASEATFQVARTRRKIPSESFFPNYAPRKRRLVIGDLFFTATGKYDQVGILRHELGHILGYRHEHLRTPQERQLGCQWPPDGKNRYALSLTPYDPDSVMHYPCSNAKEKAYFRLSPLDIEGHRKLYGP